MHCGRGRLGFLFLLLLLTLNLNTFSFSCFLSFFFLCCLNAHACLSPLGCSFALAVYSLLQGAVHACSPKRCMDVVLPGHEQSTASASYLACSVRCGSRNSCVVHVRTSPCENIIFLLDRVPLNSTWHSVLLYSC